MIRALLDHGADANARARNDWTPVTVAVAPYRSRFPAGPDPRVLELLKAAGGRLGLREAVVLGDVELARRLCDDDPALDVSGNARFWFSETYLMLATRLRHREMVRFLLDRGADVERTDDLGATPLMRAAAAGDPEVFRLILGRGADIDHDDWSDQTPLSVAATHGHAGIVEELLALGAARGLLDAVALDDVGLVAELLHAGGDPNHVYHGYGRLAGYAASRGNPDIVHLLLIHGAAHHDGRFDARPLVAEAARRGHLDAVRLLLEHGADPDQVGKDGLTPSAWAVKGGHPSIAAFLDGLPRGPA